MNNNMGGGLNLDSISQSLVSPTEDRPQITMQGNRLPTATKSITPTVNTNTKIPIMEGMIYLLNNNERPELNDNIILTISSTSNPNNILAGAKFNVYKV